MSEITVEKSLEIDAPAQEVWDAMIDVKSWPEWKHFITKSSVGGGYDSLTCGSKVRFSIMIGGPAAVPLSATVTEFEKPGRLAWQGGVKGLVHAIHSFDFKDLGGKTRVTSRETFSGALLPVVKLMVSVDDLEKMHQQWVEAIKKRVEKKPESDAPAQAPGH